MEVSVRRSKRHISPNASAKHQSTEPYFIPLALVSSDERRMTAADMEVQRGPCSSGHSALMCQKPPRQKKQIPASSSPAGKSCLTPHLPQSSGAGPSFTPPPRVIMTYLLFFVCVCAFNSDWDGSPAAWRSYVNRAVSHLLWPGWESSGGPGSFWVPGLHES